MRLFNLVEGHLEHAEELEARVLANAPSSDVESDQGQEQQRTGSDSESAEEDRRMVGGMRPMLHELTNKAFPKWTKAIGEFYYRKMTLGFTVLQPYPDRFKLKSQDPIPKTLLVFDSSVRLSTRLHCAVSSYLQS